MAQYDIVWNATLSATTSTVAAGTCLVYDTTTDTYLAATTANRGTKRSAGICLTAGDSSNRAVVMQVAGLISASISGLAAGSASWVRVSSTGVLERVTPSGSDDVFGWAEADGSVHIAPAVISASMASSSITVPISEANGGFGADVSGSTGIPKNAAGTFSFVTAPSGAIVGDTDSQALTNKTISGASNTLTVRLASDVSGTLPVANGGTGITSLGSGVATWLGTPSGANLASALTTALPDTKGGTGLTSLGSGVATFLGTPSSANLASAVTDETGSGALVFATSPTISAPTLSSTPVLSGASTSTSNDAKGTATDVNPVHVQTTDATVTTLDSFTLASNTAVVVSWLVCAVKSDLSQAAAYSVAACFKNNAGTVAQVGTTTVTVIGESDSAWDATADNSTTTIRLRITGKAATTVQWTSILTKLTVIP